MGNWTEDKPDNVSMTVHIYDIGPRLTGVLTFAFLSTLGLLILALT